jgi:NAD(P)-dependent dehydrogenase (short-subunit alcohol dehydrogenase family)
MLNLEGKVALVTGSGSIGPGWGNGKAIAVLFARQSAKVIGVDVNAQAAEETRAIIEGEGGTSIALPCDVTDGAAVRRLVEDCVARFGRIDVLVNNVGRSEPGGPVELDEETWDAQMALNLKSAFLTCKEVLPIMERQGGGAIVNISSVAGLRYIGKPQVAYSAGKAALMQFTKTTAVIYAASA